MNFIFNLLSSKGIDPVTIILLCLLIIAIGIIIIGVVWYKQKQANQSDTEYTAAYENNIDKKDNYEIRKPEDELRQIHFDREAARNETQEELIQQQAPVPQQVPATQVAAQNNHGLLKFFIKLLLLVGIAFFTLWNYKIFDINKGWAISSINNKSSYSQVIDLITGIEKIEYYKIPHSCNNDNYQVHISTSTKHYLFDATEDDIKILNTVGIVSSKLKPRSVTVIPFYVEVFVGLLVIFIPFGRRR